MFFSLLVCIDEPDEDEYKRADPGSWRSASPHFSYADCGVGGTGGFWWETDPVFLVISPDRGLFSLVWIDFGFSALPAGFLGTLDPFGLAE